MKYYKNFREINTQASIRYIMKYNIVYKLSEHFFDPDKTRNVSMVIASDRYPGQ